MALPRFLEISQSILQENTLGIQFPPGSIYSFPVLVKGQGGLMDAMFLYPPVQEAAVPCAPRPTAWLMLDSASGEVALLAQCQVHDFVDTVRYPLDSVVAMELPTPLDPKLYTRAYNGIYEIYELLRTFAFQKELEDKQLQAVSTYRTLFLQLVPPGHYPYYGALAPDFARWVGLEAVTEAAAPPVPEPGETSRETPPQQTEQPSPAPPAEDPLAARILREVESLRWDFSQKSAQDAHKDQLIDQLHGELTEYKNGLLDTLTASMENDVIKLIDDVEKVLADYRNRVLADLGLQKLLSHMEGFETDLLDLLYRQGLEPFTVEGDSVDVQRQKVLATIPTPDPDRDKTVAKRHARGWEKNGKVIRPERISAYVHGEQGQEEAAAPAAKSGSK